MKLIENEVRTDNSKIKDVFQDLKFSEEDIKIIESLMHKMTFKKGVHIIKAGDLVSNMYFIYEGCLRTYYLDTSGKEHTIQFGIKDWWITDYTAFFLDSKAILNLEVLKDAIVYRLSKTDRELLYAKVPKIESFIRKKLERAYANFQKRILTNLSQTAAEGYLKFINEYPNIEKMVKNYHIASYLGITTQSLSRIRKDLS
ncbi:Crp/Fnr family transcriptional regulator [Psychroserpens sp.]|uniref:Crp/Fnr family transcriptional regulator n=1 Tax=Psychroserpens sp. TaxID=2020870 RepID=UPI003C7281AD